MKLVVESIHHQGDASKEHVILRVLEDCDLSYYALADTTYTSNNRISNELRHFYWFPSKAVKKGEYVVLWTGTGQNSEGTFRGAKMHRFYWNLGRAVWNNTGDAAVLFQLATWQTTSAK